MLNTMTTLCIFAIVQCCYQIAAKHCNVLSPTNL